MIATVTVVFSAIIILIVALIHIVGYLLPLGSFIPPVRGLMFAGTSGLSGVASIASIVLTLVGLHTAGCTALIAAFIACMCTLFGPLAWCSEWTMAAVRRKLFRR